MHPADSADLCSTLQREIAAGAGVMQDGLDAALRSLAEQALAHPSLISGDVRGTMRRLIAKLDAILTEQINIILHAPEFQALESAWRGLYFLVSHTDAHEMLKIRVLNISKQDLGRTLRKYKGDTWGQGPIFSWLHREAFEAFGGEPYGVIVGDYYFDQSRWDVELLSNMAKMASAIHAPFISAAHPSVISLNSWNELGRVENLRDILKQADNPAWIAFRDSNDARYVALAMPRFLARLPYGADTVPVASFAFEEDTSAPSGNSFTWTNSAYAMAVNINRAFAKYGWCARIRGVDSGGAVEGLPVHRCANDDGGANVHGPTEIRISDWHEAELAAAGFMPLVHRFDTDWACFFSAQSVHRPERYDDADASADAAMAARLPYLFACSRFAHYLKCIVRDKIQRFQDREAMQRYLEGWLNGYVNASPFSKFGVPQGVAAPLAEARVQLDEIDATPGYYQTRLWLRPRYQLEGLTRAQRLVFSLPCVGARNQ